MADAGLEATAAATTDAARELAPDANLAPDDAASDRARRSRRSAGGGSGGDDRGSVRRRRGGAEEGVAGVPATRSRRRRRAGETVASDGVPRGGLLRLRRSAPPRRTASSRGARARASTSELAALREAHEKRDGDGERGVDDARRAIANAPDDAALDDAVARARDALDAVGAEYRAYHRDATEIAESNPERQRAHFKRYARRLCRCLRVFPYPESRRRERRRRRRRRRRSRRRRRRGPGRTRRTTRARGRRRRRKRRRRRRRRMRRRRRRRRR